MDSEKIMKKKTTIRKKALIAFITIIIIFAGIAIAEKLTEPLGYYHPDYPKTDIRPILEKEILGDDDYKELFYQTGLGKIAIDELLNTGSSGKEKILKFQDNFFTERKIHSEKFAVIVNHEFLVNDEGKIIYGFDLAPYKNGYVLVTKATHSLGWRHGHAGIITDAGREETLEAVLLGQDSMLQNINKWRCFPSFIMLRLKDAPQEDLDEIAEFAKNNLLNVPYGLTVGLFSRKNPEPGNIKTTQCAHIVWYFFM